MVRCSDKVSLLFEVELGVVPRSSRGCLATRRYCGARALCWDHLLFDLDMPISTRYLLMCIYTQTRSRTHTHMHILITHTRTYSQNECMTNACEVTRDKMIVFAMRSAVAAPTQWDPLAGPVHQHQGRVDLQSARGECGGA